MVATIKWVTAAAVVFIEEVGQRRALRTVQRLRQIPAQNQSLIQTLERLEAALKGEL